jgi:outer membrane protein, heavy metal efflux system
MYKSIFIWLILLATAAQAQDTLSLSLQQTDSIFLKNNLLLLAARYKVDASKALVQQARLWNNPQLSTEWNLYNPAKDKFLDVGANGQKIVQLEQVVSIAGKRSKTIQLAKANAQFSQLEFYELMRSLKTELHNYYFSMYYSSIIVAKLDKQIAQMSGIIDALELQSKKGNIPLKDVLRL